MFEQTVISQYANSPIMLAILQSFDDAVSPDFDAFYDLVFNVFTAEGYGLDVWGRIVGVSRVVQLAAPGSYFGYNEGNSASDYQPFGQAPFYRGAAASNNFALTDDAYRKLIFAKAGLNITNGSASSINAIMMALFTDYGNAYVQDNGDMTITYVFGSTLSALDHAIVVQSGVLPKPAGVSYTVVD